jgi:hypothetical protein
MRSVQVGGGLVKSTEGWPLAYPSWFSALDRQGIDEALSVASASARLPATPAIAPRRVISGPFHGRVFASEVAAIEALLAVFAVVVRVLVTPREGGPDERTQRKAADRLFEELVVWIANMTPWVTSVHAFADHVREARGTCAWWTAFAPPPPPVQIPPAEPRPDGSAANDHPNIQDSPLLTLEEAAAQLHITRKAVKQKGARGELEIIQAAPRELRIRQAEVTRLLAQRKHRSR